MDEDTLKVLEKANLEHLSLISLKAIENDELFALKSSRTIAEYCWTLKPIVLLHIFDHYNNIDRLTYLDADLYFFDNPKAIYESTPKAAVLLSKHDYIKELEAIENEVGRFNSGIISFRNNSYGRSCLYWWKEKCINWCFNTTVTGQFGDQKYLEDMPILFKNVSIIDVPGINIAPWNDSKFTFYKKDGKLYINDNPLIVYHYCGFRVWDKNSCVFMFGNNYVPIIHKPYMKAINKVIHQVQLIDPSFDGSFLEECNIGKFHIYNFDMIQNE